MLCWDQWYSDSYAKLRKLGAEIILCPSSIGNTYVNNNKITLPDEKKMWFNVIQSNSLMNNIPVVIANRIGKEMNGKRLISFWGSSFITNADGAIIVKSLHNILKESEIAVRQGVTQLILSDKEISDQKLRNQS